MNTIAHPNMFQTAYRQITSAERAFVDTIVREIAEAARRLGQRISGALNRPLPDGLLARDTKGWLQRPLVRAAITEQVQQLAEAEEISPQSWIRQVHNIAHSDIANYYTVDEVGDPVFDVDALIDAEKSGAIKSLEVEKSDGLTRSSKTKIKITMHDKLAALKMEAAYMGLDDGDNPHRKADRSAQSQQISADTTPEQADAAYAAMIGDE